MEHQFRCICGQSFSEKKYLNRHCMSFLRENQCSECLKKFTQNYNLRKHMRNQHGEMPEKKHQKRRYYNELLLSRGVENLYNNDMVTVQHRSVDEDFMVNDFIKEL